MLGDSKVMHSWIVGLFKMLYWLGFSNESLSQANYRNHLLFVLLLLAIIVSNKPTAVSDKNSNQQD